jgi:hypothetical protein
MPTNFINNDGEIPRALTVKRKSVILQENELLSRLLNKLMKQVNSLEIIIQSI